jgi:hypothetical protein
MPDLHRRTWLQLLGIGVGTISASGAASARHTPGESPSELSLFANTSGPYAPGDEIELGVHFLTQTFDNAPARLSGYIIPADEDNHHNADFYGDEFELISHKITDDGRGPSGEWVTNRGSYDASGWEWEDAPEITEHAAQFSVKPSQSISPGEYTFAVNMFWGGVDTYVKLDVWDTHTVTIEEPPEIELSVTSYPNESKPSEGDVTFDFELTNTGGSGSNPEIQLLSDQSDINIHQSSPWEVIDSNSDGGEWKFPSDTDENVSWLYGEELDPGWTISPSLTFSIPENVDPETFDIFATAGSVEKNEDEYDTGTASITIDDPAELALTANSSPEDIKPSGDDVTLNLALTNTGGSATTPEIQLVSDQSDINIDELSPWEVVDFNSDDGLWVFPSDTGGNVACQYAEELEPGETVTPSITYAIPENVDPGTYYVTSQAINTDANSEENETATAEITIEGKDGFKPTVHGFGFENWAGSSSDENDDKTDFSGHDHQSIIESEFNTQFKQEWLPIINETNWVSLPDNVATNLAAAIYETFQEAPENFFSDGHCYGMCLLAQEYYESGIPDSLADDGIEHAADITKPTDEFSHVGEAIDRKHRSQFLDATFSLKQVPYLSPDFAFNTETIDAEAEVQAIQSAIDKKGTALVGIGQHPEEVSGGTSAHQLIGYNIRLEDANSVTKADVAYIDVYDPNLPNNEDKFNDPKHTLKIDVSKPTEKPVINNRSDGYLYQWHRCMLLGEARPDFLGTLNFTRRTLADIIKNYFGGFIGISANSPVQVTAVGPNGQEFSRPNEPVDGTPPSEYVYMVDPPTGEFKIEVEGTGTGSYSVDVKGSTAAGGQIEDRVSGTITEGETQTVSANLPTEEGKDGSVSDTGPDTDGKFDDQPFNETQFNAVFGDDGTQTQNELSAAINQWFTSDSNSVNGVTLSQNDLSGIINYWFNKL